LLLIVIQHFEIAHQLLPIVRLDGYYILADVAGVPDLFGSMRPVLRSLWQGRRGRSTGLALTPWARATVFSWIALTIPGLVWLYGMLAMRSPRLFHDAWASLGTQVAGLRVSMAQGQVALVALGAVQAMILALPPLGITVMFGRLASRVGRAVWV